MRGTLAKKLRRLAYKDAPTKGRLTEYQGQEITFINKYAKQGEPKEWTMMVLQSTGPRRLYRIFKDRVKAMRTMKVHKRAPLPRERRFRKEPTHATIS
jgi:hypothetical protein